MRAGIGAPLPPWTCEVTSTGIRSFARGVGIEDLVYFEEGVARRAGYDGLPALPSHLGTPVFMPGESPSEAPYHPGHPAAHDFGLPNVLAGGVETVYERVVVAGDVLTASTCIADLEVKQSTSLGFMLIVSTRSEFRDFEGRLVATECSWTIRYAAVDQ